jgi:putative component of toxin-antitoxin plasmid stabilization module
MITINAYTIKRTPEFDAWIGSLKDSMTRLRLARRLEKAQRGLLGGGNKSSQADDIHRAIALSRTITE